MSSGSPSGAFTFNGLQVRTVLRNGEPWFVLADVCRVLEIAEPHRAASRLDEDEKGRHTVTTLGGPQQITVVSEPGLYSLVATSRKPEAKAFTRWVRHEVLPSIRRNGGYIRHDPTETAAELTLRVMRMLQEDVDRQPVDGGSRPSALPRADHYRETRWWVTDLSHRNGGTGQTRHDHPRARRLPSGDALQAPGR